MNQIRTAVILGIIIVVMLGGLYVINRDKISFPKCSKAPEANEPANE